MEGNAETKTEPTQQTGAYPVSSKLVRDEFERLRRNNITPWMFLNSGPPMRVADFYGKTISYQGVAVFEGSPRTVFWGRYIEPFLEDIVLRIIDRTIILCRDEGHEPKPALTEAGQLLKSLVRDAYGAMANVDQRLRGRGNPDKVNKRNVDAEVVAMERFIDARLTGLGSATQGALENRYLRPVGTELEQKFQILCSVPQEQRDFDRWTAEAADHSGDSIGAIFLDIDNFKQINSRFTETVVDRTVLPAFHRFFRDLCRQRGAAYRHGGEEILVLPPNHGLEETKSFGEKLRGLLEVHRFEVDAQAVCLTVSVGVAAWPQHGNSFAAVIEAARAASRSRRGEARRLLR